MIFIKKLNIKHLKKHCLMTQNLMQERVFSNTKNILHIFNSTKYKFYAFLLGTKTNTLECKVNMLCEDIFRIIFKHLCNYCDYCHYGYTAYFHIYSDKITYLW